MRPLVWVSAVLAILVYLALERDSYKCSWRVHIFGIVAPLVILYKSRDQVVQALASAMLAFHAASLLLPKKS